MLHLLVPPLGCHRTPHPQRTLKRRSLARKNREQGALPGISCDNTEMSRTALALSTHTSSLTSRSLLHSAAQSPPPPLPSQRHTQPLPSDELWALSCLGHHRGLQNKPGTSEVSLDKRSLQQNSQHETLSVSDLWKAMRPPPEPPTLSHIQPHIPLEPF